MKHIYVYTLILLTLASCTPKDAISIEHIISDEIVTITRAPNNKILDSVCLNIPLEFKLNIPSNIKYLSIDYITNNHYLSIPSDVIIYNKQGIQKPILDFEEYLIEKKPFNIIIRERNHLISLDGAKKILSKYKKSSQSLDDLKFGDTIKIAPYNEFRKQNPLVLKELLKIGDTIIVTTRMKEKDTYKPKKIKINW